MMKQLMLLVGFLLLSCNSFANTELRELLFKTTSNDGIKQFYNATQNMSTVSNVEKAYKGVATAMQARLVSSVSDKLSYFKKGKSLIEQAVKNDPNSVEIRFLRFSVQSNVPFILGYSGDVTDDSNFIIKAFESKKVLVTDSFWSKVLNYLSKSSELSSAQLSRIKKLQNT